MTRAFQKPLGVLAYYWSEGDDSDLKLFENELSDRGVQYKTLNFSEKKPGFREGENSKICFGRYR